MLDSKCCAVLGSESVVLPCEGQQVVPTRVGHKRSWLLQRRSNCARLTALTILSPVSADLHGECMELSCPSPRTLVSLAPREVDSYQPGHIIDQSRRKMLPDAVLTGVYVVKPSKCFVRLIVHRPRASCRGARPSQMLPRYMTVSVRKRTSRVRLFDIASHQLSSSRAAWSQNRN